MIKGLSQKGLVALPSRTGIVRYSKLVGHDRRFRELLEEMHFHSTRRAYGKFTGTLIEASDFEGTLAEKHDSLYVHPPGEFDIDKIMGYCAIRRIPQLPPKPNIVKAGSVGYRNKRDLPAIIRGILRQIDFSSHIFLITAHTGNSPWLRILEDIGFKLLKDPGQMIGILEALGQLSLKKAVERQAGEACYVSEKGDEKFLYVYDPNNLLDRIPQKRI